MHPSDEILYFNYIFLPSLSFVTRGAPFIVSILVSVMFHGCIVLLP